MLDCMEKVAAGHYALPFEGSSKWVKIFEIFWV